MSTTPAEAFPLHWPDGWTRTPPAERETGAFKVTTEAAQQSLYAELARLGVDDWIISTNIPIRRDGAYYSSPGYHRPEDPGVAVWFTVKGEWRVIACDRYKTVTANTRAIALTIDALRGLDRWGTSQIMERVFRGFTALPSNELVTVQHWREVLDLTHASTLEQAEARYRALAKAYHPDLGGDIVKMTALNLAIQDARRELGGRAR